MDSALAQFRANLARARDLVGLASALVAQTTPAVDTSDLLRAALVLGVSAFDHFVHEIARLGMLEIAANLRPPTEAYQRFQISLRSVSIAQQGSNSAWLDQEIRERHGWLSFQDPSKVADALRTVTAKVLWDELGTRLGLTPEDARASLRLTVDRRNKIAHESDMDPTAPGSRWPIDRVLVENALSFLDELATAIRETVRI